MDYDDLIDSLDIDSETLLLLHKEFLEKKGLLDEFTEIVQKSFSKEDEELPEDEFGNYDPKGNF